MPEDRKSPNFNRQPMLWLGIAFAIGILAANLLNIDLSVSLAAVVVFAIFAVFLRGKPFATYLVLLAFAAAGMSSLQLEKLSIAADRVQVLYDNGTIRSGDPVEVEGVLDGRPELSADGAFLELRTEKLSYRGFERKVSGSVRLFLPKSEAAAEADFKSEISDLRYGSRLRIACKLNREDAFLNPGVIQKREILERLGIDATGSIKSTMLVEKIADESVFLPLAWIYDQRANLIDSFRENLSPRAAGIMIASLLGNKYFLDKDTGDLFRDGGVFHILVISGLHITFIGGLMLVFLRRITRNRWAQFLITMLVLWSYTMAVGAEVPVVRAAVMFTILLYSYVIFRRTSLLNSLGFCGLLLLIWLPSELFDPSFQLTFVSVAAIVGAAYPIVEQFRRVGSWTPDATTPFPPNVPISLKRFCEMLYWNAGGWAIESKQQVWSAKLFKTPYLGRRVTSGIQKCVRYLFEAMLVSLIVQICMLPLSIVYFHRVSVSSILLNLWVGIFIALESFTAVMGATLFYFSEILAKPFFTLAEIFNWLMLALPRLISDVGWASFRLPAYPGDGKYLYVLYFVPILLLAISVNRWRPFDLKPPPIFLRRNALIATVSVLVILTLAVVLHPFSVRPADGRLRVDFLDVGQGDSALVTFPNGKTLLIDGGGRIKYRDDGDAEAFESDVRGIGESVVSEFLWDRGYSRIDHVLGTHADADHIQGLTDVAKNFEIGSAIFGREQFEDSDFAELAEVLRRRGIPIETIGRGERIQIGDALVEVLYPAAKNTGSASENDSSVVVRIVYGNRAVLMTGDIERNAETSLLAGGGSLTADVVKVPHHGSRTSSTQPFIDAVNARYAIISVGRSSPFGHPHSDVVERWKAAGVNVMTTGERGMISISTDGRDLQIQTFLP